MTEQAVVTEDAIKMKRGFQRGPLRYYEIAYTDGSTETLSCHGFGAVGDGSLITFYAEIDGEWTALLSVRASTVDRVRMLVPQTGGEPETADAATVAA